MRKGGNGFIGLIEYRLLIVCRVIKERDMIMFESLDYLKKEKYDFV